MMVPSETDLLVIITGMAVHSHSMSFNSHNSSGVDGFSGGGIPGAIGNQRTLVYGDQAHSLQPVMPSRQRQAQYGHREAPRNDHVDYNINDSSKYWAFNNGGSLIRLVKTELGLRSTSDIRPPGANGGRPALANGGGIKAPSPGSNISLHPSSSASNIEHCRQAPHPRRGQATPELPPESGETNSERRAQMSEQVLSKKVQDMERRLASIEASSSCTRHKPNGEAPREAAVSRSITIFTWF